MSAFASQRLTKRLDGNYVYVCVLDNDEALKGVRRPVAPDLNSFLAAGATSESTKRAIR
jgi:hypothetical protein